MLGPKNEESSKYFTKILAHYIFIPITTSQHNSPGKKIISTCQKGNQKQPLLPPPNCKPPAPLLPPSKPPVPLLPPSEAPIPQPRRFSAGKAHLRVLQNNM